MIDSVTPLILTLNEAPNLNRCLSKLHWAQRIVIIDSGSIDETPQIAALYPNVEFIVRPFDNHTSQWNFGLSHISTEWVLSLDADYVIPDETVSLFSNVTSQDEVNAYFAEFRYISLGRALTKSLYPPRAVLFRKDFCKYEPDGHTQRLTIKGLSDTLPLIIDHDDRKPLSRWLASQDAYAKLESEKLSRTHSPTSLPDRLRKKIILAPIITPLYVLIVQRTLFDGWPGFFYALQRTLAEIMLSMRLIEIKINDSKHE